MTKNLVALLSLSLLAACAPSSHQGSTSSVIGTEDAGIVGGSLAQSADFGEKSVVSLRLRTLDVSFCTGTLIGPRIVLTAAHCFVESGYPSEMVTIGFAAAPTERRDVEDFRTNDKFKISNTHHAFRTNIDLKGDVAVVLLASDAPSAAVPARLPKAAIPVGKSVAVRIYGYGLTSSAAGSTSDDQLRRVDKIASVSADMPGILMDDERDGHGTCNGDSGGPSFLATTAGQIPTVVGLVSNSLEVPAFFGRNYGDRCKQKNALTQIGSYVEWIKKNQVELLTEQQ